MLRKNKEAGFAIWAVVIVIAITLVAGGIALYQSGRNSTYNDISFEGIQEDVALETQEESDDMIEEQKNNLNESEVVSTTATNNGGTMTLLMPVISGEGGIQNAENAGIELSDIPQSWRDQGLYIGCGVSIAWLPIEVPQTQGVLNATYEYLFAASPVITYQGEEYSNLIGRYAQNTNYPMSFESVEINGTTARIYLTGTIMNNHCADPAIMAQLSFAATRFPTVDAIEIYLNGQLFDLAAWYSQQ